MSDVIHFPTDAYVDKLAVDKMVADLVQQHKDGEIQHLVIVRFDPKGEVWLRETGGLTIAQFSYVGAIIANYLQKWMNR